MSRCPYCGQEWDDGQHYRCAPAQTGKSLMNWNAASTIVDDEEAQTVEDDPLKRGILEGESTAEDAFEDDEDDEDEDDDDDDEDVEE